MGERGGALEAVVMFGGAYSGRRVFVTGHTGFKGSWLTAWLLELGADVTGYALGPPSVPSLFEAAGLDALATEGWFTDLRGDVRDAAALAAALHSAAPDIVFHLAAQPLVRRSYEEPHLTVDTNVMGTTNLLDAVRSWPAEGRPPRAVVVVTSDKCYENPETGRAMVEDDPLGGWDVYSASKAAAEIVSAAYQRSFFVRGGLTRLATARAGNVIGGGDWGADRLVPDCVRALHHSETVLVRHPDAVRPWQHVLEPLAGYLLLAARLADRVLSSDGRDVAGAWNFGPLPSDSAPVAEVVERIVDRWGSGGWCAEYTPGARHEARLLRLDASKARVGLGWEPVWDLGRAVDAAVDWYKGWSGGEIPDRLRGRCRADIAAYRDAAAASYLEWAS